MSGLKVKAPELKIWAKRNFDKTWLEIEASVGMPAKLRGHLTKSEFLRICKWKSPRSQHQCSSNDEELIKEISAIALATANEELRIKSLVILNGVSWPTASTILHFCHPDPYPILDFRAVWTLGLQVPNQYNFNFWSLYVKKCRSLSIKTKLDMRQLDMALWQYSKENQPAS